MSTDPIRKPYGELTYGEHIQFRRVVQRVAHVQSYRNGDGRPQSAVTLIPLSGKAPWVHYGNPDEPAELASDADVAAHAEAGRRAALASALRELADAIVEHALPVPEYAFHVGGCVQSRADAEAWAEHLGVKVEMGGTADDIPVARVEQRINDRQTLYISFQGPSEPEPTPEPVETPEESAAIVDANLRAMGSGGLTEPEVHTDSVSTDSASFRPVETPATTIPPQRAGE